MWPSRSTSLAWLTSAAMAAVTVVLQDGRSSRRAGRRPGRRPADQPAGRRVGVQHPAVGVQHQDRVADRPEDLAAGHRPQVEQAELVDPPDQDRRGQHEGERGQVDLPERPHPQVEQEVEQDRQEDGRDQDRALALRPGLTSGSESPPAAPSPPRPWRCCRSCGARTAGPPRPPGRWRSSPRRVVATRSWVAVAASRSSTARGSRASAGPTHRGQRVYAVPATRPGRPGAAGRR